MNKCQEHLKNTFEEKINKTEEDIEIATEQYLYLPHQCQLKIYTYDGKTSWEVYKIKLCIISDVNGFTEWVKACQLVASLRGEAAEVLQTFPDKELLNSLYNALDLRFSQTYFKDYARLQMRTRYQRPGESLQEYAFEIQRLTTLAFSDFSENVREMISLEYFLDGLKNLR
ncbi:uncharacterized protein TNCV_4743041 [Trichonephila clavipes]|nr:uncharacterized protein TNCV_4743041 [Trichonephila clavipes]